MIQAAIQKWRQVLFRLKHSVYLEIRGDVVLGKRIEIRPFSPKFRVVLGGNNEIRHDVIVQGSGLLELGENSFVGSFSVIGCNEYISIGRNCMIAQAVSIRDTDHQAESRLIPMMQQGWETSPIIIEEDVWIGHGAVITKGVCVGKGAVIGANAVVTRNVASYSIVGGVPAREIGARPA